ncbi:PREDICTED: uncharacterized protein LOC105144075 [Acromyrmex echinatior]|uniref:uncharacterized protein LOC105144075 n=1 Tax=Acromyrmex echinatior TaxID=103372 RepID=UPI000580E1D2|nr:PREDICTED: uncharacterized protein LOC105144075 [Acromyrmex echinatior]
MTQIERVDQHNERPIANKLEQDFSKLLSLGKLEAPSLYIPGYTPIKRKTTLGHRQCGVRDSDDEISASPMVLYWLQVRKMKIFQRRFYPQVRKQELALSPTKKKKSYCVIAIMQQSTFH